jgi:hypothetical protein
MVSRRRVLCERASLNLISALSSRFSRIRILHAGPACGKQVFKWKDPM